MVRELLEPVTFFSGLPGSLTNWLGQLARFQWPEFLPPCSIDDHIPTHYVDISRLSALERGETAVDKKRSQRWIVHNEKA